MPSRWVDVNFGNPTPELGWRYGHMIVLPKSSYSYRHGIFHMSDVNHKGLLPPLAPDPSHRRCWDSLDHEIPSVDTETG